MFNSVHSGPRPEPMAESALFGTRDGRRLRNLLWKANITQRKNTWNEVIRGIKNKIIKKPRVASTDAKDERGVVISVARENPAQSSRSKFQREESEGREEG